MNCTPRNTKRLLCVASLAKQSVARQQCKKADLFLGLPERRCPQLRAGAPVFDLEAPGL